MVAGVVEVRCCRCKRSGLRLGNVGGFEFYSRLFRLRSDDVGVTERVMVEASRNTEEKESRLQGVDNIPCLAVTPSTKFYSTHRYL